MLARTSGVNHLEGLPIFGRLYAFVECGVNIFDQNEASLWGIGQQVEKFVVSESSF